MSKAAELAALIGSQTALSSRNMFYNGACQISQRATSVSSITSTAYNTLDRFSFVVESLGTWTMSQDTDVPTGYGFANSLKIDCTTADASPAAADRCMLRQTLEGFDVQRLSKGTSNAESVTLSFWVKATKTGTYISNLYDNNNNRVIAKAYTVSSSNTWEYKSLTFVGDTTGVLTDTNSGQLQIVWCLGCGTNHSSGTLQTTWGASSNVNRFVGQVNTADSTNNNWAITGIQLELGEQATPFEHRSFGDELAACQRYYYETGATAANDFAQKGYQAANQYASNTLPHPTTMRSAPTLTKSGTFSVSGIGQPTAVAASVTNFVWQAQKDGNTGVWGIFSNSSGKFTLDAEL